MPQLIIDIFFATVFLLLLILLTKIKDKAFENNKDSFRYTFIGITVLGISSLLQLAGHLNDFKSVPFLSEPVYRELAMGIGVVSGITLMIAGASIWLPGRNLTAGKSQRRKSSSATAPDNFEIENFITNAQSFKRLISRLPKMIFRRYNFNAVAVFYRNNKKNKYNFVASCGLDENEKLRLVNFDFSSHKVDKQPDEIKSKFRHDFCLPVSAENCLQGLFLFRCGKDNPLTPAEKLSLENIGRLLSWQLENNYTRLKERFYSKCWEFSGYIRNILAVKNSISSNLTAFHRLFNQALGAEYFSLAIIGKKTFNPRVYTIGINGNILCDGGNSSFLKNSMIGKVIEEKKSILIQNINDRSGEISDPMFVGCGQCSLLAIPIISDTMVIAVMTLGHSSAAHFSGRDLLLAETLAYAMAPAIEYELSQIEMHERDRYLAAINGFESAINNVTDIESLLKASAEMLIDNVSTTMVRISILDNYGTRLKTSAIRMNRAIPEINTNDVAISNELTHWHKTVAEEGRLLLINQNDDISRMDKSEMELLVFKGMQSALIIPIVVSGRTFGIITLGEMRGWNRSTYNPAAISFTKTIAAKIADVLKMMQLSRLVAIPNSNIRFSIEKKSRFENGPGREIMTPIAGDALSGSEKVSNQITVF